MDELYILIVGVVFGLIFSIIFGALNKSKLKLFLPIQKFTRKLKRKRLFGAFTFIMFFFLASEIKDFFNLNYVAAGIVMGFGFALNDVIFENGISSNIRYKED